MEWDQGRKGKEEEDAATRGRRSQHLLSVADTVELKDLPQQLMKLLHHDNSPLLDTNVRMSAVHALILLRNRDLVRAMDALPVFFKLFRVHDKTLRNTL